jgi:hypothetical protein
MSHEAAGIGIGGRRRGHLEIKLIDMAVQPVQQLETVIPAPARVRQQHERLQLSQALARPQRRAEREPLIQGDRVQTVFDHRPHAHESEPMVEERAQVARQRIGNPDHREAVVLQQVPEMPGVPPIGLGFAHDHGPDLGGLADEERVSQALQEGVKPQRVTGAFDADGDGWRQRGVEPFDVVARVGQFLVPELAGVRVEQSDLLLPRVEIASDQDHESALRWCDVVVLGWAEATSDVWLFS